jgi:hypothetical protein
MFPVPMIPTRLPLSIQISFCILSGQKGLPWIVFRKTWTGSCRVPVTCRMPCGFADDGRYVVDLSAIRLKSLTA